MKMAPCPCPSCTLTRPDAVPPFDAPRFPHLTRALLGVQGDGTDGN